ncbi:MAG: hypothetical protein KDC84_15555 [Crocinitomicaceae bacterium]|nr:hypothetical protein [Crocinitomicaceae bacterium]
MRIYTLLFLIFLSNLVQSQITNNIEVSTFMTSYNLEYKGHSASGKVYSDFLDVVQKEYMTCCYDDKSLFFYHHKTYFENGNIQIDSTIDMMSKRTGKIIVKKYNVDSELIYLKKLSTFLDKNREEIPKRADVLWTGRLVRYKNGKKTVEKLIDVLQ